MIPGRSSLSQILVLTPSSYPTSILKCWIVRGVSQDLGENEPTQKYEHQSIYNWGLTSNEQTEL